MRSMNAVILDWRPKRVGWWVGSLPSDLGCKRAPLEMSARLPRCSTFRAVTVVSLWIPL